MSGWGKRLSQLVLLTVPVLVWVFPAFGDVEWKQIKPNPHPSKRTGHDLAYDSARGVIVLYGGTKGADRLQDTWEFSPENETWALRDDLPNSPPPLAAHKVFYDEKNHRTVLFGGQEELFDFVSDVWEYDGTTWSKAEIAEGTSPVARGGHSLAYDSKRGNALLFGGRKRIDEDTVKLLGDTWLYDITARAWTPVEGDVSPSPREGAGLVYDPWSDRFILFGGSFFNNYRSDETWTFDPVSSTWSQLETEDSPSKRDAASMTVLDASRVIVSCGSSYRGRYLSDTWIFDGRNWDEAGISDPRRRAGAPLVRAGTQAYLFAGFDGTVRDDTWKIYCKGCEPAAKIEGDVDGDGDIDGLDLFLLSTQWGVLSAVKSGVSATDCDLTNDDRVDIRDVVRFLSEYQAHR